MTFLAATLSRNTSSILLRSAVARHHHRHPSVVASSRINSPGFTRSLSASAAAAAASAATSSAAAAHNAALFDARHNFDVTDAPGPHRSSRRGEKGGGRNPVLPHPISPRKAPPRNVPLPPYAFTGRIPSSFYPERVILHDESSISRMRNAARLARRTLDYACTLARPDVTTDFIDDAVHRAIVQSGAYPSPLNYHGFPKSLCSSVNEVICHGIPDSRPLEMGDVVSFDVSCFLDGVHGDNCATVIVGDSDRRSAADDPFAEPQQRGKTEAAAASASAGENADWRGVPYKTQFTSTAEEDMFVSARRLVQATKESLDEAVKICKPGGCLTEVGAAVHAVADAYGYDTVQKYRGHGIGEDFHCAPYVKHYRNNDKMELQPGMIFTIEPMLTEGRWECFEWDDDWTVVTRDGGRAAQFEHTVLITEKGVEVLTVPE